jgi:PAS domain S-box-containing protein
MNSRLRLLHLEDDPDYCDLVQSLLAEEGYQVEIVLADDRAGFEAALAPEKFDLILADYLLPTYNGLEALRVARAKCPETPFLLVSGTIGEQAAIESLRCGATDYVLKHWPDRLVPAVRRAIEEAEERKQRRRVEAELVRCEKHFRALTENALDIVSILDPQGVFAYNSRSVKRVLGYEPKDLAGQSAFALVHSEDPPRVLQAFDYGLRNPDRTVTLDFRFQHRDGSWRNLEVVGQSRLGDPDIAGVVLNSRDITQRKQTEAELRESEQRFRELFESSPDAVFVEDLDGTVLDINPAACRLHGVDAKELIGRNVSDLVPPERREAVVAISRHSWKAGWSKSRGPVTPKMAAWCRWRCGPVASITPASPPCCCTCATLPTASWPKRRCGVRRCCSTRCGRIRSMGCA